jgi:hypothetical protein
MRRILPLLISLLMAGSVFSQNFINDAPLRIDTIHGYKIKVPAWWKTTVNNEVTFGGTFPAVDSVENALFIKIVEKSKFNSLQDFENWVIAGYSIGESPKWSPKVKVLLKKNVDDFKKIGNAYKAQFVIGTNMFDCCYIMTESKGYYIWIDFTATNATYPVNFPKFKEIMSTFEKL